jgi:hypothetical protein
MGGHILLQRRGFAAVFRASRAASFGRKRSGQERLLFVERGAVGGELICIGRAYVVMKRITAAGEGASNTFGQDLITELKSGGYKGGEIFALLGSVSRTGLLIPIPAIGGMSYIHSPWLKELGDLADLETLVRIR